MTQHKAIGIDLGTTNSCVAWVDEAGHTALVPNAEGDLLTPSVVLFDDAEVVVGKEARNAFIVDPARVAIWVKRDMGAPLYSRPIRGEYLPPEVIQACILRKLRNDVVHKLGPESQVVITVPAYFDEPRRKATADAGEMAGLRVLDIVNEPTAAALAFGEVLGYLSRQASPQQSLTVLVYDLGGGTFDATLLRLSPGNIQMMATDGDVQLGGYDWDMRLVAHAADAFRRVHGTDPRTDAGSASRLYRDVLEAKHTLSSRNRATIRLDHAGNHFECEVTRQAFEELTADLLERTTYTARQLLTAAKMDWQNVDRVLLVGGATRMPAVARTLEKISGIRPDHTVNPDEAVARGAALYAHYLLSNATPGATPAAFEVGNVNAHSLGVEGIEAETLRKRNVILIPRNTALPARVSQRFATKQEDQRSIVVQVLEGESALPQECTAIGRTAVRNLPAGLAQGWPVEVTFEYGTNGRLTIRAAVSGTSRETVLELERDGGLSHEGLARWKQVVSSSAGFNAYEAALAEVFRSVPPIPTQAGQSADQGWSLPPPSPPSARPMTPPIPAVQPVVPLATPPIPGATAKPAAAFLSPPPAPQPTTGVPSPTAIWQGLPPSGLHSPAPVPAVGSPPSPPAVPWPPSPPAMAANPWDAQHVGYAPMPPRQDVTEWRDRQPSVARRVFNVCGHILAAGLGLLVGYLLLHWLQPDRFPEFRLPF
jgi:molecular chaperone DnaK